MQMNGNTRISLLKQFVSEKKFSEQCKEHITIAKNCWIRSRGGEGQIFVGGD